MNVARCLEIVCSIVNMNECKCRRIPLSLRQLESRVTQTLDDLQNAQNDLATYNRPAGWPEYAPFRRG